jgi:hypothetical protein
MKKFGTQNRRNFMKAAGVTALMSAAGSGSAMGMGMGQSRGGSGKGYNFDDIYSRIGINSNNHLLLLVPLRSVQNMKTMVMKRFLIATIKRL